MRSSLPMLAIATLLSGAALGSTRAETVNSQGASIDVDDVKAWSGAAAGRSGWNWRPDGDPTGNTALPLNSNAAGALGVPDSGGGFGSDVQGLNGAPTEIYTIGGKPLSSAAVAPAPEPKGPFGFLNILTPKGVPAPAVWALILIGLITIGVAVRGLWSANRSLARLRSEDED